MTAEAIADNTASKKYRESLSLCGILANRRKYIKNKASFLSHSIALLNSSVTAFTAIS